MNSIPKLQNMSSFGEYDKENQHRANRIGFNIQRHSRVKSTLAINMRKQDKSQASTSFQNISATQISEIGPLQKQQQIKLQYKVQGSARGDTNAFEAIAQHSVENNHTQRNSNSLKNRYVLQEILPIGQIYHFHHRVKTDSNINIPLRSINTNRPITYINHPSNISNINLSKTSTNVSPIGSKSILQNTLQKPNNPQIVSQYNQQIINHLQLSSINNNNRKFNAFQFQVQVTERMRAILLDWIIDVHMKFKLQTETLFLTVSLIDISLERIPIEKTQLQLFGIAALFIASKYEEVYATPHVRDLAYVCDNAFTKQQILLAESMILNACNFDLLSVSSFRLLSIYQETINLDQKNYLLAIYLIELALIDYKTNQNPPNIIANAAIYLVRKIRKISPAWAEENTKLSQLQESQIRPCAKELCSLLQNCDKKYFNSIKKKYSLPAYMEVAKIRIEKKPQ